MSEVSKSWLILIIVLFGMFLFALNVNGQPINLTLDFETADLRGWTKTGNALDYQPTLGDNPTARHRGQPSNHQGKYWIGTYEKYQGRSDQKPGNIQGDRPQGTLTSAPFTIPQGKLSFLVGGGSSFETRVEFLIQDPIEGSIRGFHISGQNTETMRRVTWDLTKYAGKTGRIRIVDTSSEGWGHINVDDFRFSSIHEKQSVAGKMERLIARISPERIEVVQGKIAVFKSISTHEGRIEERWTGPGDQQETGRSFEVHTDQLNPGHYGIVLKVRDRYKQSDETKATLEVIPRAVKPDAVKPVAKISPERIEVVQGKIAVFKSISTPEGGIKESWTGPGDQQETGRSFEVHTDQLNPGHYGIVLKVRDRYKQSDETKATLEVNPRAVKPVAVKPVARISPERIEVVQGKTAVFKSISTPEGGIKESWTGPGDQQETGRSFEVHTDQLNPGHYGIVLKVRDRYKQSDETKATLEVNPRAVKPDAVKPVARISPERIEVVQGQKAVFESQSTPEGVIRERWRGPRGQTGEGRNFEVRTDQLNPGQYEIVLLIMDRQEQSDKALATLEVITRPVEYKVNISVDRDKIEQGQRVRFMASLSPELHGAKYRFNFGDGLRSNWEEESEIEHVYSSPGVYKAFVNVRREEKIIAESTTIQIEIIPIDYRVFLEAEPNRTEPGRTVIFRARLEFYKEGAEYRFVFGDGSFRDWSNETLAEHSYSEPGNYHVHVVVRIGQKISESNPVLINIEKPSKEIPWEWIIPGILAGFAGGYLLKKILSRKVPAVHVRPQKDPGTQQIESETPVLSGFEICLRPVLDKGKQDIEANGSLIDERREHG